MSAREEILARIRAANEGVADVTIPREYVTAGAAAGSAAVLERLVDRLEDYRAEVSVIGTGEVPTAIAATVAALPGTGVVVPPGLPQAWLADLPAGALLRDSADAPLATAALDGAATVLTGCAVAIASTGVIVLDAGPGQGRRALTLVPDHHLCVVRADQVVDTVPEAVARLDATRPMTWIAGPSATSDIELDRVEGVHGPRTLRVLVVRD